MRNEFIQVNTLSEAKAAAPWAAEIVEVDGGYHAFESMADYDQWMRTLDADQKMRSSAIKTDKRTKDGLVVYDLDPQAAELWAVAGPDGIDPQSLDPDCLPDGFRWVGNDEWELLCQVSG